MGIMNGVSVVVPVLNEVGNIQPLILRLKNTLDPLKTPYEIIFVDDHSSDGTRELLASLQATHKNVRFLTKQGNRGKAYSIIEGTVSSTYDTICMIDADLQYPPESIAPMVTLMETLGSDVVITKRIDNETSWLRKLMSLTFNFIFTRALFGLSYDTQSGLKLFKKEVLRPDEIDPTPWSFDLEFIVVALQHRYLIASLDIPFGMRTSGEAKVSIYKSSIELARASLRLRLKNLKVPTATLYKQNLARLMPQSSRETS